MYKNRSNGGVNEAKFKLKKVIKLIILFYKSKTEKTNRI